MVVVRKALGWQMSWWWHVLDGRVGTWRSRWGRIATFSIQHILETPDVLNSTSKSIYLADFAALSGAGSTGTVVSIAATGRGLTERSRDVLAEDGEAHVDLLHSIPLTGVPSCNGSRRSRWEHVTHTVELDPLLGGGSCWSRLLEGPLVCHGLVLWWRHVVVHGAVHLQSLFFLVFVSTKKS